MYLFLNQLQTKLGPDVFVQNFLYYKKFSNLLNQSFIVLKILIEYIVKMLHGIKLRVNKVSVGGSEPVVRISATRGEYCF